MAKTAVALYDSKNEAQQVKDELTNAGFSRSSIRMMDSSDSDGTDTLTNAGLPQHDAEAYVEGPNIFPFKTRLYHFGILSRFGMFV